MSGSRSNCMHVVVLVVTRMSDITPALRMYMSHVNPMKF